MKSINDMKIMGNIFISFMVFSDASLSFPNTEATEDFAKDLFCSGLAYDLPDGGQRCPQFHGDEFRGLPG